MSFYVKYPIFPSLCVAGCEMNVQWSKITTPPQPYSGRTAELKNPPVNKYQHK